MVHLQLHLPDVVKELIEIYNNRDLCRYNLVTLSLFRALIKLIHNLLEKRIPYSIAYNPTAFYPVSTTKGVHTNLTRCNERFCELPRTNISGISSINNSWTNDSQYMNTMVNLTKWKILEFKYQFSGQTRINHIPRINTIRKNVPIKC